MKTSITTIDSYIEQFPVNTQHQLQQLRGIVSTLVPDATETISYGMPAFKLNKVLVYFAGYKNHIGLYPHASPIIKFAAELAPYKTSKGAIQFPIDKKLPVRLIQKIVKFRLKELADKG